MSKPAGRSISIVVPCRNEAGCIQSFLDSVLHQDLRGLDWEIIIADGMSDDGTREVLESYRERHPQVRILDNPGKIVSTGLNAAIRAARGEVIVRMDVHTEYAPDYIRECVTVLQETGVDNVGGPWMAKGAGYMNRAIATAFQSPLATGSTRAHNRDYAGEVDTVYLGCWRRDVFNRIGYFDEGFVRNQDDEFNFRLVRSGGRIWQSPRIISWYRPRATLSGLFRQYLQYGFWKVAMIRKHRAPVHWRHVVPSAFVLANLLLLLATVRDAATGCGSILPWSLKAWTGLVAGYLFASCGAAILAAKRSDWSLLPMLPVIFATFHLSYGVGFLIGLLYWPFINWRPVQPGKFFTEITR
ncbi:MAG: glycosyltransferase family 2 protein [Acidobacteria bacterium]|nr:glycosyltransferase family 2 protein [Acidobacteriota bacterium]